MGMLLSLVWAICVQALEPKADGNFGLLLLSHGRVVPYLLQQLLKIPYSSSVFDWLIRLANLAAHYIAERRIKRRFL